MAVPILSEQVERNILLIRGHRVMLDTDLAKLYCVPTKAINQAVKRNTNRFPVDFMFQLTSEETTALRSQFVTSKNRGGRQYRPYAFTEQGVAMLSSVLHSERAIQVNIAIMRGKPMVSGTIVHNARSYDWARQQGHSVLPGARILTPSSRASRKRPAVRWRFVRLR